MRLKESDYGDLENAKRNYKNSRIVSSMTSTIILTNSQPYIKFGSILVRRGNRKGLVADVIPCHTTIYPKFKEKPSCHGTSAEVLAET